MQESNGCTSHFARCFLSLPHGFRTVRDALMRMLREEFRIRPRYVISSEGDALRDEIVRGLLNSSLLVADLSSATARSEGRRPVPGSRPNIMWEIGYAWHAEMSILLICRESDRHNIPALLKDQHVIMYDRENLDPMLAEASDAIRVMEDRVSSSALGRSLLQTFMSRCYINRFVADVPARIRKAETAIRILELNLETIAQFYLPALTDVMRERPALSVQICTLNPFSQFASARADQLAKIPRVYQLELMQAITRTNHG